MQFQQSLKDSKIRFLFLVLVIICSLALVACSKKEKKEAAKTAKQEVTSTNKEIKIGAILPLTGAAADIGGWQKKGIEAAVAEINDNGGIKGRKIKVIYEDSAGQPKEGTFAFYKLVEVQKIPVIFSSLSSVSNAIAPLTIKHPVVTMLIAVSFPGITKKSPWFFRDHPGSEDEASVMANFMVKALHVKKVVVLYCNDDFGIGAYKAFKNVFQKLNRGTILWSDTYELNQTNFRDIVAKVRNYNPEGVYVIGYVKASVILIKQLREAGYKHIISAPMALSIPTFIKLAGKAMEGVYFTNTDFNPSSKNPIVRKFVTRFYKMFHEQPNVFSGLAYDGVFMIAKAINKEGYGVMKIEKGLKELKNFQGVMGNLSITKDRTIKFPLKVVKLQHGKLVEVRF